MIVGIIGKVEKIEPTSLHINTNGLIYEVFISLNTSNIITEIGKDIKLLTTHIIREDAQLLFGFIDKNEKKMFDTLIKINGVGVKVALAVCSTFSPEIFSEIITNKDVNLLKKVVGIGPKSASRILLELSDFIIDGQYDTNSIARNEARMALESLGFKTEVINKALQGAVGDTQTLVKEGLKKLQRL